ncbi:helix-turn-helix domain-containing protein [Streptomyces monomycini]|uniref:helix-turn-helix domain-containing protein n=1 Tax=Streptomyces monomycini TaxID=371720 RepID=UPI0005181B02|nr:helix-turn-helix domain-containing protein [Streptomyces monomycini]
MGRISIGIGSRVWREGETYEVIALEGDQVVAYDRHRRAVRLRVIDLLDPAVPGQRIIGAGASEAGESAGIVLGSADESALSEARERAGHVREVLTGYRLGAEELALPGEPRPEYASAFTLMQRYASKAAELAVTVRTLRRWVRAYQSEGVSGLVFDRRGARAGVLDGIDPRWREVCLAVLDDQVDASNTTKQLTLRRVKARLDREFGADEVPVPKGSAAYRALDEIACGRGSFGTSAKARRSIANRPTVAYGRLRASRPGEYVLLDTTRLDVFAMEPVTLRWVQIEMSIAMDLFTRCITGLRLSPVSTKSVDVAAVLFETIQPRRMPDHWPAEAAWPYHGLPAAVVVDADRVEGPSFTGPGLLPDTIVVDHGKVYVSDHVTSACARLGVSIQPARPYTPTDKAACERFFRSLREGLLEALPGYKGPDVFSRGADPEGEAFFYLGELDAIIREWIGAVYHRRPHESLIDPRLPGVRMSPLQRFGHGVARAGRIELPRDALLGLELLPVVWRTIQHYGVEIDTLRYSGPIVAKYMNRTSGYKRPGDFSGARKGGRWPFSVDPDDLRRIYFRDPEDGTWHTLEWEHAAGLDLPLSADALAYAKELAGSKDGPPDIGTALSQLLEAWNVGLAENRTERRIALRMAAERAEQQAGEPEIASLSSVHSVLVSQQLEAAQGPEDERRAPVAPPPQDLGDDDDDNDLDAGADLEVLDFYANALEVLE